MNYSILFIDGADQRAANGQIPYKGRHCFLRPPQGIPLFFGASLDDARQRLSEMSSPVLMFLHYNGADVRHGVVNADSVAVASHVIGKGGRFIWFTGQGAADSGFFRPFLDAFGAAGGRWGYVFSAGESVLKGLVLPTSLITIRVADLDELTPVTRIPGYPELVALTEDDLPAESPDPFDTFRRVRHRTAYRFLRDEDRAFVDFAVGGCGAPPKGSMSRIWVRTREGAPREPSLLAAAHEELQEMSSRLTAAQMCDESGRRVGCTCGGERLL